MFGWIKRLGRSASGRESLAVHDESGRFEGVSLLYPYEKINANLCGEGKFALTNNDHRRSHHRVSVNT